ncbi:hypothetical protein JYU21_00555 [Alkaliphilus sp. AH-315-G20]|nr:hypothetical protein [Alkaliphilus sp. AH-315-G20]
MEQKMLLPGEVAVATIGNLIGGAAIIPVLYDSILVKKPTHKQTKRLHRVALTHLIKF